ncbi:MAG: lipid IV(A) 3-deoxy-D-manno-octulosonic acid transferase [Burkholderiales bacterium]
MRLLYTLATYALLPWALLHLLIRGRKQPAYLQHVPERFGLYRLRLTGQPIWVHAVSVGETRAAEPLVAALQARHPGVPLLLTHMTPTGREISEALFGGRIACCYLPYDLPGAVQRFLRHFRPVQGIVMETELWPNLVDACARLGVPLHLVNARMSQRSAARYARFGSITKRMLSRLNGIGAQTDRDAARLVALGAHAVHVTGNIKFDRAPSAAQLELGNGLRRRFGSSRKIFLAASTREGEEPLLLEVLSSLADKALLMVIVPRHPQRFDAVADLLSRSQVPFQRRSDNVQVRPDTQVVLGDSMGEMFAYYWACDVAFVGGSLLPHGGQNLIEACAVGKPVIVGPHTFNFEEATERAIEAGAALRVADAQALASALMKLLSDQARAREIGDNGRRFTEAHRGATEKTLTLLGL